MVSLSSHSLTAVELKLGRTFEEHPTGPHAVLESAVYHPCWQKSLKVTINLHAASSINAVASFIASYYTEKVPLRSCVIPQWSICPLLLHKNRSQSTFLLKPVREFSGGNKLHRGLKKERWCEWTCHLDSASKASFSIFWLQENQHLRNFIGFQLDCERHRENIKRKQHWH